MDAKQKYEGLSLIETLITLVIVGIIIIVISTTLAALIKASAISASRTLSREESEFVLELLEKEIENAKSDDINVFYYNPSFTNISNVENATVNHLILHNLGTFPKGVTLGNTTPRGNEIHIRPLSSEDWVCIGLYEYTHPESGETIGALVKNTVPSSQYPDPTQTYDCMVNTSYNNRIFLTSEEIDVEKFEISLYDTQGDNTTFLIDLTLKPVYWIPGPQSQYKPEYVRQLVVSTEKLTF